jgi:CheY-like chemotaxis protein
MPEICGYQTIEKIRQRKAWSSVPIIARTAKAMKADSEKCFETGRRTISPSRPHTTQPALRMCSIARRDRA